MKLIKRAKWAYCIVSAIMILLGIVLILYPGFSAVTLCYLFGAMLMVFGIVKLVGYFSRDLFRLAFQFDLALGVFSLIAGAVILFHPANVALMLPVLVGVFVMIDGVFKLQTAGDAKRFGLGNWWLILALAIVTCLCGMFLVVNPFDGARVMMTLLGVTLLVDGIQNLYVVIYTVRAVKESRRDDHIVYEEDPEEEER